MRYTSMWSIVMIFLWRFILLGRLIKIFLFLFLFDTVSWLYSQRQRDAELSLLIINFICKFYCLLFPITFGWNEMDVCAIWWIENIVSVEQMAPYHTQRSHPKYRISDKILSRWWHNFIQWNLWILQKPINDFAFIKMKSICISLQREQRRKRRNKNTKIHSRIFTPICWSD